MNENDTNHAPQAPEPTPEELTRRRFFKRVSIIVGGATTAGLIAPAAGFILAPLTQREPREWRKVGKVADFNVGETVSIRYEDASPLPWAGVTARTAAWLRREAEDLFIAYSIHCTHLGCPVRWIKSANLFMCPCHGGVFYKDGAVAAGPPPAPLARYPVRIVDGDVEIQTAPLPILTR